MRAVAAAISLAVVFASLAFPESATAQDRRPDPSPVAQTIDRGLAFLVKDGLAWKNEHSCVSCHHAGMVVWAMREAKQRGHSVDEQVLADFTSWIAKSGDGKTGVARPASAPKALNTKALYYALALGSDPKPDSASREGMKLWLKTMREDQLENGSWAAWPETRAPLFGDSNDSMTSLATLAMTVAAESTDKEAKTVRDKGIQWLASASIDDEAQSVAIRLVLWKRLNRPDAESEPLIRRIKDRQNADGGWSQTPKMPSDAWATGQALYALGHTEWKADDPAVARGQAFLIATQRDDGSWPMTSRPTKPNGEGAKNLIPIIGAGSAWAVLGLTRSLSGSHDHP